MTIQFSNTQLADTLEKAAEHVRAGWIQNQLFDDDAHRCCASGAIWLATGLMAIEAYEPNQLHRAEAQLWYEAYRRLSDHVGDDVPCWNDSIGQTSERVVDAILRLAKELRNTETP